MKWIFIILVIVSCSKPETVTPQPKIKSSTIQNLMPNGGGRNTTDWHDWDGNGVADGWMTMTGTQANIGHDGTWRNDYQRVESTGQFCILSPGTPDDGKQYHDLSFKYRSNTRVWVAVMYSGRCGYIAKKIEPSDTITEISVRIWSPRIYTIKWYNSPCYPGWLELDEINIY